MCQVFGGRGSSSAIFFLPLVDFKFTTINVWWIFLKLSLFILLFITHLYFFFRYLKGRWCILVCYDVTTKYPVYCVLMDNINGLQLYLLLLYYDFNKCYYYVDDKRVFILLPNKNKNIFPPNVITCSLFFVSHGGLVLCYM